MLRVVQIETTNEPLSGTDADLRVLGRFEGEDLPGSLAETGGAEDAKAGFKKTAVIHDGGRRHLVVGLGKREDLDPERVRVVAALAVREAGRFDAKSLAWAPPRSDLDGRAIASALVDGTILASYRFDRFRSRDEGDPPPVAIERLILAEVDEEAIRDCVGPAEVAAKAANRARDLQSLPSNLKAPETLAERAREIAAAHESVSVEVFGREEIAERGMGGLAAVGSGSDAAPRLIALRYEGGGAETIGLVGKGITFDSGGISIKPAAGMHEMKMDMSGAAAVLEAVTAVAEMELALNVAAVIPAAENMPSGHSMRPGDIITQLNGKTVEINNTDAEGRLVLADALTYCVRDMGADRVVDLATLTGAVVVALGSTYAALISNDDEWAERVRAAAEATGELAWRLPLHAEYKELTKGKVADLTNTAAKRKAGTIYAGSFLEEFVDGKPWVHLDIAGTAWDVGREYVGTGPSGFGVRLLVALLRELAAAA
jgi:leucyl aminopeptidase